MGWISESLAAANLFKKVYQYFNNLPYRKCDDYYYEELNKKVFVRKNGNGLIVCSFRLKVIDPLKTNNLIREVNISDSKKNTKFPSFKLMQRTTIEKVFSDYGFWYKSDNDIITKVEEYYDEHHRDKRKNKRCLSFKFTLDTAKLKKGQSYNFGYAISIPGMFPIENGVFDSANSNRSDYQDFRSYFSAEHISHHLRFSAYFENGIEFSERPCGFANVSAAAKSRNKNNPSAYNCTYKENILYSKYHFEVKKPQNYTNIYLKWNIIDKDTV